jgi:hypothetical protein
MRTKKVKQIERAFYNWSIGRIHLNFPNGNSISTVWGSGTYSDNYDNMAEWEHYKTPTERLVMQSDTAEIMITCPPKLEKQILKKYGGGSQPLGRIPILEWLEIVNLLAITNPRSRKSPTQ